MKVSIQARLRPTGRGFVVEIPGGEVTRILEAIIYAQAYGRRDVEIELLHNMAGLTMFGLPLTLCQADGAKGFSEAVPLTSSKERMKELHVKLGALRGENIRLHDEVRRLKAGAWVSVKDRLPNREDYYLTFAPTDDPKRPLYGEAWFELEQEDWPEDEQKSWYERCEGWTNEYERGNTLREWSSCITHWMPMPEWPEEFRKERSGE